jgi:D-sedoheptulose 7-phosphate isomerase
MSLARTQLEEAAQVLQRALADEVFLNRIDQAGARMVEALKAGKKIISCGNGGSMCDAMHFAEELTGKFRNDRPGVAAISISDPGYLSCVGNDYGYERVFARYLESMGQPGDVLLAITTSGNSANVVLAAETARAKGMLVVALTGNNGGKLAPLADIEIRAPHQGYADRSQEIHIKVIHTLILTIEAGLFPNP